MSLKTLVFAILISLGLVATSIVVFQSYSLQSAAEKAQIETLSNVLRISSNEVIADTVDKMRSIRRYTKRPGL